MRVLEHDMENFRSGSIFPQLIGARVTKICIGVGAGICMDAEIARVLVVEHKFGQCFFFFFVLSFLWFRMALIFFCVFLLSGRAWFCDANARCSFESASDNVFSRIKSSVE